VLLNRGWIEAHIPHQGSMCLLDEVVTWDDGGARCRSSTHRLPDNPLRAHGRLGVACGIEYAAQAMAVHGALLASMAGEAVAPGMLASVRNVQLLVDRLDNIADDLVASVERLANDEGSALYQFSLAAGSRMLLTGRAVIAFSVPQGPPAESPRTP
jgi:predicted hotdog family 3-hydroxylacyl-ACP dehydratase